jgi:hypothetical protein
MGPRIPPGTLALVKVLGQVVKIGADKLTAGCKRMSSYTLPTIVLMPEQHQRRARFPAAREMPRLRNMEPMWKLQPA